MRKFPSKFFRQNWTKIFVHEATKIWGSIILFWTKSVLQKFIRLPTYFMITYQENFEDFKYLLDSFKYVAVRHSLASQVQWGCKLPEALAWLHEASIQTTLRVLFNLRTQHDRWCAEKINILVRQLGWYYTRYIFSNFSRMSCIVCPI